MHMIEGTSQHLDAAAEIWAEATAARDGDDDVPPRELARPIIQSVFDVPKSLLLLAVTDDDRAVGFVASSPASATQETVEVRYVGARPDAWRTGVGTELMWALPARFVNMGFNRAQLMVYADNVPAVRLYERHGWRPLGKPTLHPTSGKLEQRYELDLADIQSGV